MDQGESNRADFGQSFKMSLSRLANDFGLTNLFKPRDANCVKKHSL
uniref:Uncharacterized protein n=1 Tax=Anguilla anguilla TaxID=7936 RepID=A0A0E9UCQ2_ANGAN